MPRRRLHVTGAAETPLRAALRALRDGPDIPRAFPPDALAEAEAAAKSPRLPGRDATDLPLFTIDPPGSTDLDQAMHLARRADGGYRVHYAITDVAAFVTPSGAVDAEAHRRVLTLYLPDGRVPLHPPVLSEGAASLLPGRTVPALLWRIDLDAYGRRVATDVGRALVRSRVRLDYATVQQRIDAGTAEEPLTLLRDIGRLREDLEVQRGGVSLNVPEQEIVEEDGAYRLVYRAPRPADGWNAQISLLAGMAAADLMTAAGTGVLRTLPTAPDGAVARLRRSAKALGVDWPHHVPYAALVRTLDPNLPRHAAFLQDCTALLRGAGYTVFTDGNLPALALHAAVADEYTHCTAPLRRLVDRYAGELCVAAVEGREPPEWVRTALAALPAEMAEGSRRANRVERECVDIVESALLMDRVGEVFAGTVVDVRDDDPTVGTVHLEDPAVVARLEGAGTPLPLGERLDVRLTQAYPGREKALFAPA
ncbi:MULTISPECIES: RNB domain-containing ribonuclease [Streptomyces]|uniref:RNB domain-containing ribonuclease n=1 Tax=Streptomyces sudanensis TaxID=436397 RepID=A0ABY4TAD3_9ACTN|nr:MULTISPECIES: RNB domain-containing ribonuclease [Streptomyces]MCP9959184.1 RNB domain-containing ribonuclease [Streptomyces sudanensis]MCP9988265.1 RNB domain-containing ribonuclease [Streptomyces sudanensis]MCQ0000355.1 RNB domain-containing ribonuclease [Streptomyces sudanensis]URN15919.1 RNB domain-containing ribonuclease [Streptomyces sudanensis]